MNKIYKVIWSKAKHTYVVASEIAKGHTKGETTGRGLKKLAAALLVAAALMGPNYAWAADIVKVEPAADTASTTAVEVYTKDGAEKEISTLSTLIGNNATQIGNNATNIKSNTDKISKLESAVGDDDSGLKKDVNDLKTTVGDSTGGLVKDVADSKTAIDTEKTAREAGDKTLDDRITAVKEHVLKETGDNYVSKTDAAVQDAGVVKANRKIGENVTALGKGLYDETAARIGADAAQDKVIQQVNDNLVASVNTINKNVADGFTALNQADANEAAAREAKDNELNERITNEANGIHDEIKAGDEKLDTRITNVKEYLEKQTSDKYVSKADAAVQDGDIVKADKTIGENVTNLDAALAKETAARLGADKAQDKVIQQVNDNLVQSVNTINKNVADGFKALNAADANEAKARADADAAEKAARIGADAKLVEAVNSSISLSADNVLQKNTTSVDADGNVTTGKADVTEMILNKGKMILNKDQDNQITLSDKGIKVGLNSGVMDKDGFYAGGDTAEAAKAALNADGSIKGAGGIFTVDGTTGNVSTKGSLTAASGKIGNVSMSADGTVTGVKDLTASGKVTAGSFTDGTATMSNGSLNGVNQINATGNIVTTGNMQAHDMTATGTITGQNINGTTGTFGSLSTTGNASVGGTLTTNGITNTGNTTTDSLTVKQGATVGGNLGVTGDITGKSLNVGTGAISGGQITGTGLDVGAGTIKTIGAVETGTLETTGNATIGGNLTVDKNLTVNGEFNAKTLSSKLDENNYTTIHGGKTQSKNLKLDAATGETQSSASTFDENGSNAWAKDDDSIGKSSMTADKISQSLSETGDNPEKAASRVLSQNTNNKYEITDSVVEGNQSNVENRTADTTDSQISFKDDSGKVLNKSYITQNLKKVLMGVEEGDNKTTIEQDANNITNTAKNGTITNDAGKLVNTASGTIANMAGKDITNTSTNGNIANTAANGTISNNAKNLTNTASENITNKAENGNISNIASNGTISNEAKTISNKATEALTNDAKTITNKASESVTTQIGDGSAVKSVMNGNGIANTATDKAITNDAATITNTGTTSVTNQVGNNKVLVDTTHVQSAFGNTIYTTWDKSGITNNATDKTVATNAKNIQNTATGDITNTAEKGTITNKAQNLVNDASGNMTTTVGGEMKTTVTGKVTEDYKSDLDTKVGGNQITAVTGDSSLNAKNITNTATVKLSNSAADIENTATNSITDKVGKNTSWKMTDGTVVESVKDASGKTNQTTTTAADTYQFVKDGDNTLAKRTSSTNDNLNITDSNNTYTKITTATGNKQTVTGGTETASTNLTKEASNTLIENGTQSVLDHMAADTSYTVMNENGNGSRRQQTASEILDRVTDGTNTSEVKQTASEVAASAKNISNTATDKITSQIGDGSKVKSEMTADGITNTAEGGTIYNKSKDILNEVSGDILNFAGGEIGNSATKITNITGDNTVTSDTKGTTFENKAHSTAIEGGSVTKTTISGNTLETGKATMDYAEVMKDLGVRGNAAVDGNTTLGKKGADTTLTVNSTSTFNKDVTMKENLDVEGTTTTDKLVVDNGATIKGGATVTGGTTTDTLHVTSTSTFDGKATFKDIVTMEKDLSVGGNATVAGDVTADSYKVGDKTYIDKDGINANNQVIRNVGQGNISEGSTDAVSGGQLYETNTRVSGLETRMGTVETRVDKLDNKIDKVGANAAAMANLHPLEFDEDSKWNVAAAVGSSGSETASAVGVFYRPNENVMVNASAAMGTGENMFGGGVSLRLGHGGNKAKEAQMKAAAAENKELRAKVDDLTARMDALLSVLNPNMSKDFPDVPENHWAYEAVSRLAGNGIVEGYEDGKYHGERQMTRYEMAEIIYNALSKGAKAEKKLVEEFRPELQAMAAQKKA